MGELARVLTHCAIMDRGSGLCQRKRWILFLLSWHLFWKKMRGWSDVDHWDDFGKITRMAELSRGDKKVHVPLSTLISLGFPYTVKLTS
jgi:hypothetical protein